MSRVELRASVIYRIPMSFTDTYHRRPVMSRSDVSYMRLVNIKIELFSPTLALNSVPIYEHVRSALLLCAKIYRYICPESCPVMTV